MNNVSNKETSSSEYPSSLKYFDINCCRPAQYSKLRPPIVHIYSKHPLAHKAIETALCSDRSLRRSIRTSLPAPASVKDAGGPLVAVIDICSVDNWTEIISNGLSVGSFPLALLPDDLSSHTEQLRVLYMGARGIVTLSPNLAKELPVAVHSVAKGKLWISRSTLNEYVRQTNLLFSRLQGPNGKFTAREEQIINLVIRGFANKQIGSILSISERTVKFHVSNILQKSKVENREALQEKAEAC
jgi:DNA-binding NarL/FixJ family response regulator